MPEMPTVSRSRADEIADRVLYSVETPAQIFFLALFVFGVISIAATTLVGPCGNVDDDARYLTPRTARYEPGATVFTASAVVLGETVVSSGVCGIIESVDEENETARVRVLAKAQPFFTGPPEEYRPLSVFGHITDAPLSAFFFLHRHSPVGEIPFTQLVPVATQPYTDLARFFYVNIIYIVMIVLTVALMFFGYVGVRYERKRKEWYERHMLRGTYISRLMRDREKTRNLREKWGTVASSVEEASPESWKKAAEDMNDILEEVLVLLRFEGENLTDRLSRMNDGDLWTIEKLWKAHSMLLRVQKEEDMPVVTEKAMKKAAEIYKESFIWLGLLPHSA